MVEAAIHSGFLIPVASVPVPVEVAVRGWPVRREVEGTAVRDRSTAPPPARTGRPFIHPSGDTTIMPDGGSPVPGDPADNSTGAAAVADGASTPACGTPGGWVEAWPRVIVCPDGWSRIIYRPVIGPARIPRKAFPTGTWRATPS